MSTLHLCTIPEVDNAAANNVRDQFFFSPKPGVTLEDVSDPRYWTNVIRIITRRRWSLIEVVADDGSWEALIRICGMSGQGSQAVVSLRVLRSWVAPPVEAALPPGATVEHIYGSGWRAVYAGQAITERQATKADAVKAVREHAARVAPPVAVEPPQPDPTVASHPPKAVEEVAAASSRKAPTRVA